MAETDRREAILARLEVVIAATSGVKNCCRNTLDLPERDRPAVVILDADETVEDPALDAGRRPGGRANALPIVVTMTPEVYILTGGPSDAIGRDLNALRIALIAAVLGDNSLLSLAKDGDIRYLGFSTGFASGRSIEGEAGISFQFRYVIQPSKL